MPDERRRLLERPDARPSPLGPILAGTVVEDWYCTDCNTVHSMEVPCCPCWTAYPSADGDTLPGEFR